MAAAQPSYLTDPSPETAKMVDTMISVVEALELDNLHRQHGFDFHATQMETSKSAFFRPPDTWLRSTAVPSIVLGNGCESDDPFDIREQFQSHWGNFFGDPRYCMNDVAPNEDATTALLNSIHRSLSVEDAMTLDETVSQEPIWQQPYGTSNATRLLGWMA